MKAVMLESPYAGDVPRNLLYARFCVLDCERRGEAPIGSHLAYCQVLDDQNPEEHKRGIGMGNALRKAVDTTIVYEDLGVTSGMLAGKDASEALGHKVIRRKLPKSAWHAFCEAALKLR